MLCKAGWTERNIGAGKGRDRREEKRGREKRRSDWKR